MPQYVGSIRGTSLESEMRSQSPEDDHFRRIQRLLALPAPERPEWVKEWRIDDSLAWYRGLAYVPTSLRLRVLEECYDDALSRHFGFARTLELILRAFY